MTETQTMDAMDDLALLREYVEHHSEAAFETLVSRRVGFVYSAAMRQVRDPQLAGEITQTVFIILAQKAARISEKTILTGWLFKTTRFVAIAEMRKIVQRRKFEQEADMESEIESTLPDALWEKMSPLLDAALAALGEKDRQAVLLRFFENKSLADVGNYLATNEDTAGKRVSRALDKLRNYFSKQGVASSPSVIAGAISANSVHAAPVALAKTVSAIALAKAAAAAGSELTFLSGALKFMAWTKMNTVAVVGVAVILAASTTTTLIIKHRHRATEGPVLQRSWAFVKYATPADTLQSSLWAMSNGDVKTLMDSYADGGNQFMETAGKGKSDKEVAAMFAKIAGMISDFQVISNQTVSSDETILHFHSSRIGNMNVPMKKIGSEWKINGNIASDAPATPRR